MSDEMPGTQQEQAPAPSESGVTQEERTFGMLCHLLAFAGIVFWFFGNILGPLVIWLMKKEKSSFVNDQGKESLNFQISVTIAGIAIGVVSMILQVIPVLGQILGLILGLAGIALGIYVVVQVIMAALKANTGVPYRYPYKYEFIK